MSMEHCCECGGETGNAGQGEGSLYLEDGSGPFCEECWGELDPKVRGDTVNDASAQ